MTCFPSSLKGSDGSQWSNLQPEHALWGWFQVRLLEKNTPRRTCFAYDEGIKLHGGENTVWTVDCQAAGVYVSRAAGCRGSRGCLHQCWHLQDPVPSENPAKIDRLPPGLVKRARTDTNWCKLCRWNNFAQILLIWWNFKCPNEPPIGSKQIEIAVQV